MRSWGKYSLGDSEGGGTSPEGRVARARAHPPPPLSTTVPGLSQSFSSAWKMGLVGNGEKRLRAELQQVLPPNPQVLTLSPPFLAPVKS